MTKSIDIYIGIYIDIYVLCLLTTDVYTLPVCDFQVITLSCHRASYL